MASLPSCFQGIPNEYAAANPGFRFSITASDICTQVLRSAANAVYVEERTGTIPLPLTKKYLLRSKDRTKGVVRIAPVLRSLNTFGVRTMTEVPASPSFPIVAIGASAGGLYALEQFFDNMPADSGMAFVVIQHLSPDFKSLMDDILSRRTTMRIKRVEDGMALEPDTIYLIPPKCLMTVVEGLLHLRDKLPQPYFELPIDIFFHSLARYAGNRAVAVILSGTGSDGSRGIHAIHRKGGVAIAQTPESAQFDGMPRSALATGLVDFELPPDRIPELLLELKHHPESVLARRNHPEILELEADNTDDFSEIFNTLR